MRSINRHSKRDIILIVPNNIYKVFMHFPLKKPEVKDIYRLFGEYGFFLVVQADGQNGLAQMLREIDGGQKVI